MSLGLIGLSLTSRASDNFGFISGTLKLGLLMPAMSSAQPFGPTVQRFLGGHFTLYHV